MKILIEIECGNDAFQPYPGFEVARILTELSDKINPTLDVDDELSLFDKNGNNVGSVKVIV